MKGQVDEGTEETLECNLSRSVHLATAKCHGRSVSEIRCWIRQSICASDSRVFMGGFATVPPRVARVGQVDLRSSSSALLSLIHSEVTAF